MSDTPFLVEPALLERFLDRVGGRLRQKPVELSVHAHREAIGSLLGESGAGNHYELLGVQPGAGEGEISAAYLELARRVHPENAPKIGLDGRELTLKILFERATQAYLELSDPERRRAYDLREGISTGIVFVRSEEETRRQKEELAAQSYRRAQVYARMQEYHYAVELLKEAVRLDLKPEYLSLLGEVQGRNPRWREQAVRTYREAIRLKPKDPGLRTQLGILFEKMERFEEAKGEFEAALERMAENPLAEAGLNRVREQLGESRGGLAAKLFGRRKS